MERQQRSARWRRWVANVRKQSFLYLLYYLFLTCAACICPIPFLLLRISLVLYLWFSHKWIFYFSVLFLLTMNAFSFIWLLLLLFYHIFGQCSFHFRRALFVWIRLLPHFLQHHQNVHCWNCLKGFSFYHHNILLYLFTVVANCAHWSNLIYHCAFDFILVRFTLLQ